MSLALGLFLAGRRGVLPLMLDGCVGMRACVAETSTIASGSALAAHLCSRRALSNKRRASRGMALDEVLGRALHRVREAQKHTI